MHPIKLNFLKRQEPEQYTRRQLKAKLAEIMAEKAVEQLFCTTSVGHTADEREDAPEIAELLVTSSQRWHDSWCQSAAKLEREKKKVIKAALNRARQLLEKTSTC
uniref:Transcriptional regulator n=1 Tax=Globodera pallida TaxID=36090 RepID=A0A183BTG3_GLOPA